MNALLIVLTILQVVAALFLIVVILLQSGKKAGLSGAIAGGAETFMSKSAAKSWDAKLSKMTKWVAIAFMIITFILCVV